MELNNKTSINKQNKNCSFCNKEIYENENYISGGLNNVCLCNQCAKLLLTKYHPFINKNNNFTNNISNSEAQADLNILLTPSQIKAELDKYIVGQEDAKRTMATAIYNHYIRIGQNSDDIIIDKSNICLIGPTGTGKCVCDDTKVKLRNKKTGEIIYDTIDNILNKYEFREQKFT